MIAPPDRVAPIGWSLVEADLGFALPADYKELIGHYGAGAFDAFLLVLLPSDDQYRDLAQQTEVRLDALRGFRDIGGPVPYDIDTAASLIPWAITDNGDVFYWRRDQSANPDDWTVVLGASRGDGWEEFDGSAADSLIAMLRGDFGRSVFPDDFPSDDPSFDQRADSH